MFFNNLTYNIGVFLCRGLFFAQIYGIVSNIPLQKCDICHSWTCSYLFRLNKIKFQKNKGASFRINKQKFAPAEKNIYIGYSFESNVLNTHWHWFSDSGTG